MKKVLITGGSGFIGRRLTSSLLTHGYEVVWLGRSGHGDSIPHYQWNPSKGTYDPEALAGVDWIVHLAGANVGGGRWTRRRKQEIRDSRTASTQLLARMLQTTDHRVQRVVAMSASGFYGTEDTGMPFREEHPRGKDFLAGVVAQWEQEAAGLAGQRVSVVRLRAGVVLGWGGGALQRLVWPVRWFVGAPLGSGRQMFNWVHVDDLCSCIEYGMLNLAPGVYNVTGQPVTNRQLFECLARTLHRSLWLPAVPAALLRMVFGEMADVLLKGGAMSGEKLQASGFSFTFPTLESALNDLMKEAKYIPEGDGKNKE